MSPALVHDAEISAALAAAAADVVIGTIDAIAELQLLCEVLNQIWGPAIVPPRNLLRGMALAGSGIALARRAGEAVGFSIGLLGWTGGVHFH